MKTALPKSPLPAPTRTAAGMTFLNLVWSRLHCLLKVPLRCPRAAPAAFFPPPVELFVTSSGPVSSLSHLPLACAHPATLTVSQVLSGTSCAVMLRSYVGCLFCSLEALPAVFPLVSAYVLPLLAGAPRL